MGKSELTEEEIAHADNDKAIMAIKCIRGRTGWGLKESKDLFDQSEAGQRYAVRRAARFEAEMGGKSHWRKRAEATKRERDRLQAELVEERRRYVELRDGDCNRCKGLQAEFEVERGRAQKAEAERERLHGLVLEHVAVQREHERQLATAKAEALGEAADRWEGGLVTTKWLRERAKTLRGEG